MKNKRRYSYGEILMCNIIVLLIIPLVVIMIIFSGQLINKNEEDYLMKIDLVIHQVRKTRQQYIEDILKIADNITNNTSLCGFLISPYTSKNFNYYMNTIRNVVVGKVTQEEKYKVKIYYTNESIPRGMETFYNMKDIEHIGVIKDFLEHEEKSIWLIPQRKPYISKSIYHDFDSSYTYLRKVLVENKLVYIVAITLEEAIMNSFLYEYEEINQINQIISDEECILVNQSNQYIEDIEQVTKSVEKLQKEGYQVNEIKFDNFPQEIIYIWEKNHAKTQLKIMLIIFVGIISLAIIYILVFLKRVFKQIFMCIETLEYSIENELYTELEEYDKEKKEINDIKIAFNSLINKIQILIQIAEEQSSISKESQLKALQHQINPHFMYNTLEVFSYKMELYEHFEEADAIVSFSQMLRYNISSRNKYATIREELQQVEKYMNIQSLKYEIDFKLNIDQEVYEYRILRFILQPIVENCFTHGYQGEPLQITIDFKVDKKYVTCIIGDDGRGIEVKKIQELNEMMKKGVEDDENHIGLRNISKRLKLFYGEKYKFEIEKGMNKGIYIILQLPILTKENLNI